jgi:hypothetical protein
LAGGFDGFEAKIGSFQIFVSIVEVTLSERPPEPILVRA